MSILKKLLEVKSEIGTLVKKSNNPFFKSKYLDLNDLLSAVEPLLHKHGLVLLQPIKDGQVFSIIHDTDSNEQVESGIYLPQLNDPQKLGSAVTYFRRYTLQSLLSLQAEDDDGNKASRPEPKAKPQLDDVTFTKLINAIVTKAKDKKGVLITCDYVRDRYDLTSEQSNELLDVE